MASETTELAFVRCPSCRSLVPASATRCRICNSVLEGATKHEEGDPTRNAGRVRQKTMSAGPEEVAAALAQSQSADTAAGASGATAALPIPGQTISLEGAPEATNTVTGETADEASDDVDPLGIYLQELDEADSAGGMQAQEASAPVEQGEVHEAKINEAEAHESQAPHNHESSATNGHGSTESNEAERDDPFALVETVEEEPAVAKERSDARPVWGGNKASVDVAQASAHGTTEPQGEIGDGGEKAHADRTTGGFSSRRALNFGGGARQPNPERSESRGERQKGDRSAPSSREQQQQQQSREASSRDPRREQGRGERSGDVRRGRDTVSRDGQQGQQSQGRQQSQSRESRESRGGEQRMEQRNDPQRNEPSRNRGQDDQRHASQPGRGQERTRSTKFAPGRLFGWLVSYANPDGRAIELREGKFFVTQSSLKASDLVLDDESVSTPHSLMSIGGETGLFVQDLMSERGVFVRSGEGQPYQREEGTVQLKHGDWIRFGEVEFLVSFLPGR